MISRTVPKGSFAACCEVAENVAFQDGSDLLLDYGAHVGRFFAELGRVKGRPIPTGRRPAKSCLIGSSVVSDDS